MTPIEIIALIVIIVSVIKILVILVKPKIWVDSVVKRVWANPMIMSIISLVLAAIVLYYLIQSGLTIVQILAVTAFVSLLIAIGVGTYANELISMAAKMLKKGIMKKAWLYIIIWIVLLVWGAYELFM